MGDEWDELSKHGRPVHLYTNDEDAVEDMVVVKMPRVGIQSLAWGDEIPLADTLAAINGARETKRKKRKDTQRIGRNSENRAKGLLKRMGFKDVQKLSTKWNGEYSVRAAADFKGIWPKTGQDMLCEVKHTEKPRLLFSALRKHQTKNLTKLARRNGIALLIWTYEKEKLCMRWGVDGIDGFVSGTSLKIEQARELSIVGGQPALWSVKK